MHHNEKFQWQQHFECEEFFLDLLKEAKVQNPFIRNVEEMLYKHTSTRLLDWVDHISLGYSADLIEKIEGFGFELVLAKIDKRVFEHKGAQFPLLVVSDLSKGVDSVSLKVESICDFLASWRRSAKIYGTPYGRFRKALVNSQNEVSLFAVERRFGRDIEGVEEPLGYVEKYMEACEMWKVFPRSLSDSDEAMQIAIKRAEEMVALIGTGAAASLMLEQERNYWEKKNRAGQMQKLRQDRLGLGWANHDHHTFRSSRKYFLHLVRLFEIFGFHCRERFWAGQEAGWGAQVMENSDVRAVLFLDVDLTDSEIAIDFAHIPLPEEKSLGTIGLWCALHGDSILSAGMHHLEAQFEFSRLKEDLEKLSLAMMDPFSDFTYLKQAFTVAEMWKVDDERLQSLLQKKQITKEQAEKFSREGALGSHLENLQRRGGYKGFNQKNVSSIISKTDPRKAN